MSLIRIGEPDFSLLRRGFDLRKSPRIIVYAVRALIGTVIACACFWLSHSLLWTAVACLVGAIVQKVWGLTHDELGYNHQIAILDWWCDVTLNMLWLSPVLWSRGHHTAALLLLIGLLAYPWSEE